MSVLYFWILFCQRRDDIVVTDMVADMVANIEVDMVAHMEVDKVAVKKINIGR